MSQRIRIRCKDHEPRTLELESGGSLRTHRLPDWTDVEVVLVRDDGTEEPINAVNAIEWRIRPGETSTAVLEVAGPALEVEAELGARAPAARPALDALCSDHRNAWTRFAAAVFPSVLEQAGDARTMARMQALAPAVRAGDAVAEAEFELELRGLREEAAASAARLADALTEEWKRRFGG